MDEDQPKLEHLRDQLREMQRALEQVNRETILSGSLGVFLHEQRNGLSHLASLLHNLFRTRRSKAPTVKEEEHLESDIVRAVTTLQDQQRFLLDFLTARERPLAGLPSCIHHALSLVAGHLREEEISLSLSVEEALDSIRVPAQDVESILASLLLNSIDSLKQANRSRRRISIVAKAGEGETTVTVSDNGQGIPGELRDKIWEFGFTTRRGKAGIGLAVARALAERLGGQLSDSQGPKRECRFVLSIPSTRQGGGREKRPLD